MKTPLELAERRLVTARWNLAKARTHFKRATTIQPYIDKVTAIEKEIAELKGKKESKNA